jgi:O-antigen ligase
MRIITSKVVGASTALVFSPLIVPIGDASIPFGFIALFIISVLVIGSEKYSLVSYSALAKDYIFVAFWAFLLSRVLFGGLSGSGISAIDWTFNALALSLIGATIGVSFSYRMHQLRLLRSLIVSLTFVCIIYGLWELFQGNFFHFKSSNYGKMVLGWAPLFLFWGRRKFLKGRCTSLFLLLVLIFILGISGERKAILAFAVATVGMVAVHHYILIRNIEKMLLVSSGIVVIMVVSFASLLIFMPQIKEATFEGIFKEDIPYYAERPGSLTQRLYALDFALDGIEKSPFLGNGVGIYKENVTRIAPSKRFVNPPHNFLVLISYETGIISGALYLLVLILAFFRGLNLCWKSSEAYYRRVGVLICGMVLYVFITNSLLSSPLLNVFFVLLVCGFSAGASLSYKRDMLLISSVLMRMRHTL